MFLVMWDLWGRPHVRLTSHVLASKNRSKHETILTDVLQFHECIFRFAKFKDYFNYNFKDQFSCSLEILNK